MTGMTRELLILRHGKADSGSGMTDFERPLKDKGKRDIQRIGVWLQEREALPDTTVASPAERALVTAQKSLKAAGMSTDALSKDKRIYEASRNTLLDIVANFSDNPGRVMLVGHNPGLSSLVGYLAGPFMGLAPGMLARLAMPADWRNLDGGCARLLDLVDPSTLPRKFPFPHAGASEYRDRPAYYYTQSSVIPFRQNGNRLEILVIESSKKKHWVVPKGIKDPGLSPQESAAKEAWEEAGVEGRVLDQPLGEYVYDKWGSTCTCTVYPMEVTKVIPEAEWEESHRGRRWVTPEQASEHLKQEALKDLVLDLAAKLGAEG